jgi:UDP-galactopyranose mutase
MTLYQLYNVTTPYDAKVMLNNVKHDIKTPKNLEEWILSNVGTEIYETFVKGYTTKQWGRDPKLLPSSIIRRLPIRLTFDDNYFFDKYQGIPIGGYTRIFEKLLDGIEVRLNVDYFNDREYWNGQCKKVVYTGPIDRYYNYKFGELEYRSLEFKTEIRDTEDFQGVAVMNYTDTTPEYTRIVEHKHFEFGKQNKTIITTEYPRSIGEPYYPVNDDINNSKYNQYKELMKIESNVIFGGRLTDYKYYDMHQVIASALKRIKDEI